jgi:Holin of 3TMs, for gene-transfer release
MSILSSVMSVFTPITTLIGSLSDNSVKKEELMSRINEAQFMMATQLIELEEKLLESQAIVLKADAESSNVLQKIWRPITMLSFLGLIIADQLGFLTKELSPQAWSLLQLGMGGYIAGRSVEKIAEPLKELFFKKNNDK